MHRLLIAISLAGLMAGPAAAQPDCPSRIEVVRGDTLSQIAQDCRLDLRVLRQANPNVDPRRLSPGATLTIPSPQMPYSRQIVPVAPPIARPPASRDLPTALYGREIAPNPHIHVDPAARIRLPGELPLPGEPGSPGFPLR